MTGRHRPVTRWTRWATCVAAVDAALLTVGVPAALIGQASTPDVQSSSIALPSAEQADPVRRGGPIDPVPAVLPTIVPADAPVWEPAKGRVIVDGRPLPTPVVPVQASAPAVETIPEPDSSSQPDGSIAAGEEPPPLIGVPDVVPPANETNVQPEPDPIVPVIPDGQTAPTDTEQVADPAAEPTP